MGTMKCFVICLCLLVPLSSAVTHSSDKYFQDNEIIMLVGAPVSGYGELLVSNMAYNYSQASAHVKKYPTPTSNDVIESSTNAVLISSRAVVLSSMRAILYSEYRGALITFNLSMASDITGAPGGVYETSSISIPAGSAMDRGTNIAIVKQNVNYLDATSLPPGYIVGAYITSDPRKAVIVYKNTSHTGSPTAYQRNRHFVFIGIDPTQLTKDAKEMETKVGAVAVGLVAQAVARTMHNAYSPATFLSAHGMNVIELDMYSPGGNLVRMRGVTVQAKLLGPTMATLYSVNGVLGALGSSATVNVNMNISKPYNGGPYTLSVQCLETGTDSCIGLSKSINLCDPASGLAALVLTPQQDGSAVRLTWGSPSDGGGCASLLMYYVYAADLPTGPWITPFVMTVNTMTDHANRQPGLTYYYRYAVKNSLLMSALSPVVAVTMPACVINSTATSSCGQYAAINRTCVLRCPDGFFGTEVALRCVADRQWNSTAWPVCAACDAACETCHGPSSQDCTSCASGFFLASGYCLGCTAHCDECIGVQSTDCTVCSAGYYLDSATSSCTLCPAVCETCNSSLVCTSCHENDYLPPMGLCSDCEPGCIACDGPPGNCTSCFDSYFLVNNTCEECDISCKTCSGNATVCTSCALELFLVDGRCAGCDASCATCSGPGVSQCTGCAAGRLLSATFECQPCADASSCTAAIQTTAPPDSALPMPLIIGASAAGLLLLLIALCVVIVVLLRRRGKGAQAGTEAPRKRHVTMKMKGSSTQNPLYGEETQVVGDETRVVGDRTNLVSGDRTNVIGERTNVVADRTNIASGRGTTGLHSTTLHSGHYSGGTDSELFSGQSYTQLSAVSSTGAAGARTFHLNAAGVKRIEWSDLTTVRHPMPGAAIPISAVRQASTFTDMALRWCGTDTDLEALTERATEWSNLHHTHCVPLFGVVVNAGSFGVLSKQCESSLPARLTSMSDRDKLTALAEASKGLAFIHNSRVVHGALQPECLQIDRGVTAIGHFGVGEVIINKYTAPEVAAHGACDAASDVWAFATICNEVLGKGASKRLAKVLRSATSTKPHERCSATELMEALNSDLEAATMA